MSAALFIVLDAAEPGFDTFVNGKALSQAADQSEKLALRLGVPPLWDFFSADEADFAGLSGEDEEDTNPSPTGSTPAEWFDPEAGLTTVRALRRALADEPSSVPRPDAVLGDLEDFEKVLTEAAARGLRWHLSVDF